jgi:hypothetical protein
VRTLGLLEHATITIIVYLFFTNYICQEDPAAWHGDIKGRPLPKSAGDSDGDFELAKQWLSDCTFSHSSCQKKAVGETRLPTRVLDLGPSDGSEEPYLLETHGIPGRYITLSHTWGGEVPLTTTSSTITERKQCIPLALLPKTFHDAVIISRKMNIRYLWIDSLCIIQDSKLDWEKESALMGDVYGRSYLTIAARGATNADIGCFISRPEEPPPCRLDYRSLDGYIEGQMYVRDPSFQLERIDKSPLDQRGWVLQERALSLRILYYGSQQLYWECASATIRQDGKFRDVDGDDLRSYSGFKEDWDFEPKSNPKFHGVDVDELPAGLQIDLAQYMGQWHLLVEEYTRRQLTFVSDKLPAIAGIAKKYQQLTGYTYAAGLWKEDLPSGLLWLRSGGRDAPISTHLPTWSWARFSGKVDFLSPSIGLLHAPDDSCKVIDLSYDTTDNLRNYGELSSARIQIEGRVVGTILVEDGPTALYETSLALFTKAGAAVGTPSFDEKEPRQEGFECFCLLVHGRLGSGAGLILEQVNGSKNVYRRIGYVGIPTTSLPDARDGRIAFSDVDPEVISII